MTRILVADGDALLVSALLRALKQLELEAYGCTHEGRLDHLLRSESYDLILLDSQLLRADRPFGLARVVVMVALLHETHELRLSCPFSLLRKPFTSVELASVLSQELGRIASRPTSLVEALSRAHRERSDISLEVRAGAALARISVANGEVVHAICGELEGEAALLEALARASLVTAGPPANDGLRTIRRGFRGLVLGLLGELERDEQSGSELDGAERRRLRRRT